MTRTAVLLLFCSALTVSVLAQTKSPVATTLFSVNKNSVSTDEFIYLYNKNHQHAEGDFTKEKIEEYLTLYVNFKLKVEEARRRGMDTTRTFRREFEQYKEELRKPYLPGNNLTDSLVRMTYERTKEEVKASHILLNLNPDAEPKDTLKVYTRIVELKRRATAGENFANLAVEFSEDPSAKINKGDLGYFTAMQMVYPFENAAYSTPPGKVSDPVRTRFGYHIIKVEDRRPARGEVEVSHIMLRIGDDKDNEAVKNMAFQIYDELQRGMNWEAACKQYSEDPGTKDNGGKLRPFGAGTMANVPEFERVAFELQKAGEISDPVRTQYGWHILRLERKIPLAAYDDVAPSLKNRVSRDERSQISKAALQAKLRKEMNYSLEEKVLEAVLSKADSTLQQGKWSPSGLDTEGTLFKIGNQEFSVGQFRSFVSSKQQPNAMTPRKYLHNLYNNFVDESILLLMENDIAAKNPEYRYLLNEYYEGILLFEIMEKEVWNKASEDSVGQHNFYLKNKTRYKAEDRIKGTFYSSSQKDILQGLEPILQEGDKKKIQEYITHNKIKTESGYYKKADKAVLGSVPWQVGIHSAQNNEMFYLAWIKEVVPAGVMNFEEARPTVVSDYQNALEAAWIAQLRKKYSVKINNKGKALVVQELQRKQA